MPCGRVPCLGFRGLIMEQVKHTPGPWHWDSDPIKGDPLRRVRYRVAATGKTITQCYYSSGDENAKHDARLIAAAPIVTGKQIGRAHV